MTGEVKAVTLQLDTLREIQRKLDRVKGIEVAWFWSQVAQAALMELAAAEDLHFMAWAKRNLT